MKFTLKCKRSAQDDRKTNMNCKLTKLSNGLQILTVPMPTLESATVTVWVRTGSRNEADKILGISHFLEHMAFKGGKKYTSAKAVSETIDAIGGEFNASTSKEWTKYYVRCRSQNLDTAFDILSDMVLSPLLKTSDIKREKGVIIEEMGMYEDMPMAKIGDYFEQLIFSGHKLGRDIIGTRSSVTGLMRSDFVKYLNCHYRVDDMLITIVGGIDEKGVLAFADKYFGKLKKGGMGKFVKQKIGSKNKNIKLYKKDIQQTHLILGFPADPLGRENRYKDAVTNTILSGGMSSRLFTEVREKRGLAYAVKSGFDRYADAGCYSAYAGTDPKNATEAIKVILDQCYGLANKKYLIKSSELKKAKEFIKGHSALSLEDTRGVSGLVGYDQLMLGKIRTPKEIFAAIDEVTANDVYASAKKVFINDKLNLAVIGTHKSQSRFEKLLK